MTTYITADIWQPNRCILPNIKYAFSVSDPDNLEEVKKGICSYTGVRIKKQVHFKIPFPSEGSKLHTCYPNLVFEPGSSYIYDCVRHNPVIKSPITSLEQGRTLAQPVETGIFAIKKIIGDKTHQWQVLILT